MCMHSPAVLVRLFVTACISLSAVAVAADHPGLGESLTAADIDALDFVVLPNGDGLPVGSGTVAEGRALYEAQCVACHGQSGEGALNDRLAGGVGSIGSDKPVKTVGSYWPHATTLFDYIRRAMPYQTPGSLSADDVYALTAYVLHLNDIVDENGRMDANTLPDVQMPNREGFVWAVPSD